MKVFLKRSQLPYEMLFILGKTMKMIINELSFFYKKEPKEIDTDTIIPYIVVVLIKAIAETHQELILETDPNCQIEKSVLLVKVDQNDFMNSSFTCRLIMI